MGSVPGLRHGHRVAASRRFCHHKAEGGLGRDAKLGSAALEGAPRTNRASGMRRTAICASGQNAYRDPHRCALVIHVASRARATDSHTASLSNTRPTFRPVSLADKVADSGPPVRRARQTPGEEGRAPTSRWVVVAFCATGENPARRFALLAALSGAKRAKGGEKLGEKNKGPSRCGKVGCCLFAEDKPCFLHVDVDARTHRRSTPLQILPTTHNPPCRLPRHLHVPPPHASRKENLFRGSCPPAAALRCEMCRRAV